MPRGSRPTRRLADSLSERIGAPVLGPLVDRQPMLGDCAEPFEIETACAELGLDQAALSTIVAEVERILPDIIYA